MVWIDLTLGAPNWCMFWCMFACDVTAIYCDILQNQNRTQVSNSVQVMRIHALTCNLLQASKDWTQNPPESFPWGFDSPSRHHYNQQFRARSRNAKPIKSTGPPNPSESWKVRSFRH
jgi:hypothetical protein